LVLFRKAVSFVRWMKLFRSPADVVRFRRCDAAIDRTGAPVTLHVRAMQGLPLICRPATTDTRVLCDTFCGLFHLPPANARLPDDAVILDLGANVGYTAAHLAVLYPRARVISVELDEENAQLAKRNLAPFGSRCEVVHAAIWSEDGEVAYGGDQEWAFSVDGSGTTRTSSTRTAPAIRIETLLSQRGIDHVDYMKMDIEGAEAAVLTPDAGWPQFVRSMRLETHLPATIEGCQRLLEKSGFVCSSSRVGTEYISAVRP
jgi:FkbM family methyltransferase